MKKRLSRNRAFLAMLTVATAAHLALLLVPVVRQQADEIAEAPVVTVRLSTTRPETPEPEPPLPITEPAPQIEPAEPVALAELPAAEPAPSAPPEAEKPRISAQRILSDLRERQEKDPLSGFQPADDTPRPNYFVRHQPVLEDVLNEPSLQLPFEDTRIYLVDSYDPGLLGDVEKFFDDVAVPFGFTTKNNTRVQCAWMLVVVGCGWGPLTYHDPANRPPKRRTNR